MYGANMEPLPSVHPLRATAGEQQNLLNRETSIVEVARTDDVGRAPNDEKPHLHPPGFSDDRGAGRASTDVARATPAPAIAHVSASTTTSPPSLQTSFRQGNHSPTQSEIDAHPIRQRLSVHGDCVVASGYGVRRDSESEQSPGIGRRQDETAIAGREHLAATDTMTDIKEGDKGMCAFLRLRWRASSAMRCRADVTLTLPRAHARNFVPQASTLSSHLRMAVASSSLDPRMS